MKNDWHSFATFKGHPSMQILLLVVLFAFTQGHALWGKGQEEAARNELRETLEKAEKLRDQLHDETAFRWDKKQLYIQKREEDKQVLLTIEKDIERLYQEQARIAEEIFSRERMVEDENVILAQKKSDWQNVQSALGDELKSRGEALFQMFPLDLEASSKQLNEIQTQFRVRGKFLPALEDYVLYRKYFIKKGTVLSMDKTALSPDGKSAHEMTLGRFGNVFAYGKSAEAQIYVIRQTGRLGAGRFQIELVENTSLTSALDAAFPNWVSKRQPTGPIPVDVLQNTQSRILTSGGEATASSTITKFVKSGGITMYPLLALPLWALVLIGLQIRLFLKRQSREIKTGLQVVAKLEEGDNELAKTIGLDSKTLVSDVLKACTPESSREDAENKIEGILVKDEPVLNKHVNTIAVIAGVAPLLGLLGTVTGMISLFDAITRFGTGDPQLMAGGISEALITTETGLAIAIPLLLVHNFLKNWRTRLKSDFEKNTIDILSYLYPTKA
jgi:biopolymer transport protein ExbB